MPISISEVETIAERWSKSAWDQHEAAFARQWMTQAQDDVRVLVELVRLLQEKAVIVAVKAKDVAAESTAMTKDVKVVAEGAEEIATELDKLGNRLEGVEAVE